VEYRGSISEGSFRQRRPEEARKANARAQGAAHAQTAVTQDYEEAFAKIPQHGDDVGRLVGMRAVTYKPINSLKLIQQGCKIGLNEAGSTTSVANDQSSVLDQTVCAFRGNGRLVLLSPALGFLPRTS
jgi:hypothetical protein